MIYQAKHVGGAWREFVSDSIEDAARRYTNEAGHQPEIILVRHLFEVKDVVVVCPTCGNVFVRRQRRRFCTAKCASTFLEAQRKGKRREYMRDLMRVRRAKAKAAVASA